MRAVLFTAIATSAFAATVLLGARAGAYAPGMVASAGWAAAFAAPILLLAGLGLEVLTRRGAARPRRGRALATELVVVTCGLLAPPLLNAFEMPLAFALFAVLGLRLRTASAVERNAAAVAVGLDFAIEALLVNRGDYAYAFALIAPLPLWLPAAWANVGIAALRLFPCLPGGPRAAPSPAVQAPSSQPPL